MDVTGAPSTTATIIQCRFALHLRGEGWLWRCQVGERGVPWREVGLHLLRGDSAGHISPDPEGGVTRIVKLAGGQAIAAELKVVVDAGMSGQEALGMPN